MGYYAGIIVYFFYRMPYFINGGSFLLQGPGPSCLNACLRWGGFLALTPVLCPQSQLLDFQFPGTRAGAFGGGAVVPRW